MPSDRWFKDQINLEELILSKCYSILKRQYNFACSYNVSFNKSRKFNLIGGHSFMSMHTNVLESIVKFII